MSSPPFAAVPSPAASLEFELLRSCNAHAERPALVCDGEQWSYRQLKECALAIAATLQRRSPEGALPLTAVFAHRSRAMYAGILGVLLGGHGYVPLTRRYPVRRTRWMLEASGCRTLIVDERSEPQLDALLERLDTPLLILLPDRPSGKALGTRWPQHTVLGADEFDTGEPTSVGSPDGPAYLLFTSGSTGTPKGVLVTRANLSHFVACATDRYSITSDDRFSQMFEATFDLSAFDLFAAWTRGACVCCPFEHDLLNPDSYIRQQRLTVWASVPSVALFMRRFGALRAERYPTLRWSLFCGEALPAEVVRTWGDAASFSTVENLYGPTEATVACLAYRWDPRNSPAECRDGIVPIGRSLPGTRVIVVDESLSPVAPGRSGELLLGGPQVAPGYWRDSAATARSFVVVPGMPGLWYRTGDRVREAVGNGPLTFIGRMDHQVKVRGHRVELGEVEAQLRAEPGVAAAAAVPWPTTAAGAEGLVAFVAGTRIDQAALIASLKSTLPSYAVPRSVVVLASLPYNANGKVDRQALIGFLNDDASHI